jgi:hypothetical protein
VTRVTALESVYALPWSMNGAHLVSHDWRVYSVERGGGMSVGTQWELVRSTHLEDQPPTIERLNARRRFESVSEDDEPLSSARGVFVGALLGSIAWLAIFATGFALLSLLFG